MSAKNDAPARCRNDSTSRALRTEAARFVRGRVGPPRRHPVRLVAHEERDRRDARRRHATGAVGRRGFERRGMRRQPAPPDRAGEAELVQHRRVVAPDTRGRGDAAPRHWPAPRSPAAAGQSRARRARRTSACPARRAATSSSQRMNTAGVTGSISRRRRPMREAMDASEEPALAPLQIAAPESARRCRVDELAAQDHALALERQQRGVDVVLRHARPLGEAADRHRPGVNHPAMRHRQRRFVASRSRRADIGQRRVESRIWKQRREGRARARRPPSSVRSPAVARAARRSVHELIEERRSTRTSRRPTTVSGSPMSVSSASCSSSAVADVRPRVVHDLVDRRRIEPADLTEDRFRQHPPHLDRARPPFLERRIVEIRVRIGVQDLVREGRRHRRIDGERLESGHRASFASTSFSPSMSIASVSTSFITREPADGPES